MFLLLFPTNGEHISAAASVQMQQCSFNIRILVLVAMETQLSLSSESS